MSDNWKCLNFINAHVDNEYIYASNYEYNLFFRISRQDYRVECIGSLDNYKSDKSWQIRSIQRYGDKLYLFSYKTYEVVSYDLNTLEFSYFYPEFEAVVDDSICAVCVANGEAYLLTSIFKEEICIFSMKENRYLLKKVDVSQIKKEINEAKCELVTLEKAWVVEQKIWRCVHGTNKIVTIDIETMKAQMVTVPIEQRFFSFDYIENSFYLSNIEANTIVKWNEKDGIEKVYHLEGNEKKERGIRSIVKFKERLFLLPGHNEFIVEILEESNEQNRYFFSNKFNRMYGGKLRPNYIDYYFDGEKIILFPFAANGTIEFDIWKKEIKYFDLVVTKNYFKKYKLNCRFVNENKTYNLEELCEDVPLSVQNKETYLNGNKIWESLK